MVPDVESEFYSALDAVDRNYDPDVDMHENWAWGDEADLQDLLGDLRERHPLHQLEAFYDPDTDAIHLDRVVVQKDHRKKGVGSAVMKALTDLADRKQKTMTLQTAARSQSRDASPMTAGWGTTSRSRLVKFYGGHGFKENSSKRHYRPELMGDMHREPKPMKPRTRYSVDRHNEYAATAIHSNRTGQIFTGPMHVLAHNAAAEAGHEDAHNPYMWTDGFITHDGKFVDREEANARTGRKESVDLMASGHLPLASKEDASRATMSGPKEAQFRALHLKSELSGEERHFFDALDAVDRHTYRSAAIQHKGTGEVFEGSWHGDAIDKMMTAKGADPSWGGYVHSDWTHGFVTDGGVFETRSEVRAKDLPPESRLLHEAGHLPKFDYTNPADERDFFDALDLIDRHNLFRSAAIRHRGTGKIFEGTWHEGARQAASEAGPDYGPWQGHDPWNDEDEYEDGFMTHEGKFLDRGEAEVASFNPETRAPGDRESIGLMIKGHLPMDESLADNDDVWKPLRTRLKEHIARKSGNV